MLDIMPGHSILPRSQVEFAGGSTSCGSGVGHLMLAGHGRGSDTLAVLGRHPCRSGRAASRLMDFVDDLFQGESGTACAKTSAVCQKWWR
jgi:hypothetical protein